MLEKTEITWFKVKKRRGSIRIDDDAWAYVNGSTIQIFRNPKKGENVVCIRLTQKFLKEALATEVYP